MDLLRELKSVASSVLPIVVVATILCIVFGLFTWSLAFSFLLSTIMVIVGLTVFLLGANIGLVPVGNHIGSTLTKRQSLPFLIIIGFIIGLAVTLAEPDVQVLAIQVHDVFSSINLNELVIAIALGVGSLLAFSLVRAIIRIPLKIVLFLGYLLVFSLISFVPESFAAIAFDSGGATTGPLSVPFIMALGMGVLSARKHDESDEFGFVALASLGPILCLLLMGLGVEGGHLDEIGASSEGGLPPFWPLLCGSFQDVCSSLFPLVVICLLMQVFAMKLPPRRAFRLFLGIFYSYIGLAVFLAGTEYAFSPVARMLGEALAERPEWMLLAVAFTFGATVVLAEPAIWVLTEQVETETGGVIQRRVLLIAMAIGVAFALLFSMIRMLYSLSLWWFLVPGYILILLAMWFTPQLFCGIAFDSGGVATGPMSSTFLLPFAIGAGSQMGGESSFGMIGLIAMMPILMIELLGIVFRIKTRKTEGRK